MTRPAEPLTFTFADAPEAVWTFEDGAERERWLSPLEQRLVLPGHFGRWFSEQVLEHEAGRIAKALRLSRLPTHLSTALGLAVRCELRGTEVRRQWVAFSQAEREFFDRVGGPPGGTRTTDTGAVRFTFSPDEPPLLRRGALRLIACELLAPLHAYRPHSPGAVRVVDT